MWRLLAPCPPLGLLSGPTLVCIPSRVLRISPDSRNSRANRRIPNHVLRGGTSRLRILVKSANGVGAVFLRRITRLRKRLRRGLQPPARLENSSTE